MMRAADSRGGGAPRERHRLYPAIEPTRTGQLPVGDGHVLYFEECGNPRGKPVLMVHGGPGGGGNPTLRRFHDPARYRIVIFDQRGCGRSTPNASLDANTTWHLVADMERLREHLRIERWQLCGGSWGSTLSLAYAQTHPARVSELILRGVFLLRRAEIDWFYTEGCNWLFPDAFAPYRDHIPEDERGDMVAAYHRRLTAPDTATQLAAAKLWSRWEGETLSLLPNPSRVDKFGADDYALAFARIECHYFINRGFFATDDHLLRHAPRLAGIPGIIAHGRYDVVTPLKSAHELAAVWPDAALRIVPDAGHSMTESGLVHEIIAAGIRFADGET